MDSRSDGCFFSSIQTEAVPFTCVFDLVRKVDQCCSQMDTPQANMELRYFGNKNPMHRRRRRGKKKPEVVHNPAILSVRGRAATFVVTVLFRQNTSLQGIVQWCDGKAVLPFRSALELLHLMDSAIEMKGKNIRKRPAKSAAVFQGVGL